MASQIYPEFKEALMLDTVGYSLNGNANLKVALVDTDTGGTVTGRAYSATNVYWSDLTTTGTTTPLVTEGVIAIASLSNVTLGTVSTATLDADDAVFTSVGSYTGGGASDCDAIVLYHDTGVASTSRLIAWLESDTVTGLSVVPNGSNINVNWDAAGIFTL